MPNKVFYIGNDAVSTVDGLWLTSSNKRVIDRSKKYDRYFDLTEVKGDEVTLMPDGDVFDTLSQMAKISKDYAYQTKAIAAKLKGTTLNQTLSNLWHFLYGNVQYKKDHPLREQLRTPIRTWKDRIGGVDCDCYSIFISSILLNLNIPHSFRIAAYSDDYQHVYVVVPKDGKTIGARSTYYVVDPVTDKYDYEVPFSKKHDSNMKITALNGLGGDDCQVQQPLTKILRRYMDTTEVEQLGLVPTIKFLRANCIPFQEMVNKDTNAGSLVVHTPNGIRNVPTIINKDQAAQLLADYKTPIPIDKPTATPAPTSTTTPAPTQNTTPATTQTTTPDTKKNFPWIWVALGAAGLYLLGSSDESPSQRNLDGVPRKKRKKDRVKTIHV